jgi:SAM-dependent methyltransferase
MSSSPDGERGIRDVLRDYWNRDAATYDVSNEHELQTPTQRAVWASILDRLLPPPPARVLDVGAGTGFLSLPLARLGYSVTGLDLSPGMLEHLVRKARSEGLTIEIVEGAAEEPPAGPFDVVVERLVLWTIVDPVSALKRWRAVAPAGRLVSFGGTWSGSRASEAFRTRARHYARRLLRETPQHHAPYPSAFTSISNEQRADPDWVVGAVEAAGWTRIRLDRLEDAGWAQELAQPLLVRMIGAIPEFAVSADAV